MIKLENTCADILVYNYVKSSHPNSNNLSHSLVEVANKNSLDFANSFTGPIWNKVFRSEIVKHLSCGKMYINNGEDMVFCLEALAKAGTIEFINYPIYNYIKYTDTMTDSIEKNIDSYLKSQDNIASILVSMDTLDLSSFHRRYFVEYFLTYNLNHLIRMTHMDLFRVIQRVLIFLVLLKKYLNVTSIFRIARLCCLGIIYRIYKKLCVEY